MNAIRGLSSSTTVVLSLEIFYLTFFTNQEENKKLTS